MTNSHIKPPASGEKIRVNDDLTLTIPAQPIIPFVEGDGIGVDITPVMRKVIDTACQKAYGDNKKIAWMEVYAGEKAAKLYSDNNWLPAETLQAMRDYVISIKGPLATPTGGGMRSLNVAMRQQLDLYACVRPVRYFNGVVSPLKNPEKTDMIIFRENAEDIYAGIEWQAGTDEAAALLDFLQTKMGVKSIRFPDTSAFGIKPISREGSRRLIRRAIQYALDTGRRVVTLVHKGNIMKFTEGAFMQWGYEIAREEFAAELMDGGPWHVIRQNGRELVVNDFIADNFLQQILINPEQFDAVATMNLNGDYISDALAAQVGGIGIAPGANISDEAAVFEATHGTAPKRAGQNKANPGSLILSAEMMLRHMQWTEAADAVIRGMSGAIAAGQVTYDLARGKDDAKLLSSSEFGDAIIAAM